MKWEWNFSFQPAKDVDLAEFETSWGCVLPIDYRNFLKTTNGGKVEYHPTYFKPFFQNHMCQISEFYGLGSTESPLERRGEFGTSKYDFRRVWDYRVDLPRWLLVIGTENGSSRLFVMDLRPEKLGTIYLNDLDYPPNPNPPFEPEEFNDDEDEDDIEYIRMRYREWVSAYYYIAPSFSALLKMFNIPM